MEEIHRQENTLGLVQATFTNIFCLHMKIFVRRSLRTYNYHANTYLVSTVQTEGIRQHIIERRKEPHRHVEITFTLALAVAGVRFTAAGAARQIVRVAVFCEMKKTM